MPLSKSTTSANQSEQREVIGLLERVKINKGKGRPKSCPKVLQGDKGYDSQALRNELRCKGVKPAIPRRIWKDRAQRAGRKPPKPVDRFKVERSFSWLQRKFRRLCVRWERRRTFFNGFLKIGIAWMSLEKLIKLGSISG
jgi:Transposase DDE domain